MISAKVIAHSKNTFENEIATIIATFPRYILAEFNTHRMFSKNSASSRAIPFEKMLKSVKENPFIPIAWQKDHKGMQGTEYITDPDVIRILEQRQRSYAEQACWNAESTASEYGVTKQLINRWLEPFMWHTVIVTATEWENFFALRCPQYEWRTGSTDRVYRSRKDIAKYQGHTWTEEEYNDPLWLKANIGQAEIHMMALAECMWDALNESTPVELNPGEWHIPFGDKINLNDPVAAAVMETQTGSFSERFFKAKTKIATAMCARVSYTVVGEEDKRVNYVKDVELHDRLLASGHMSPFEHCAQAMNQEEYLDYSHYDTSNDIIINGICGNFRGFMQYRKMIPNENRTR